MLKVLIYLTLFFSCSEFCSLQEAFKLTFLRLNASLGTFCHWIFTYGVISLLLFSSFIDSKVMLLKKTEIFAPRAIAQIDDRVCIQCQYHFVIRAYWKRMTCTFNNATRRSFYLTTLSYRTFVARIEFYYRRYRKFSYCAVKFIPVTWDIYNTISLRAYLCVRILRLSGFSYKLSKFYKVY